MSDSALQLPFDRQRLDSRMDAAGVDLVLATSRHNVQYLLDGYRPFFIGALDSFGLSRVVPTLGYPKCRPEQAFYLGNPTESYQQELAPLWVPRVLNEIWTTGQVADMAAQFIASIGMQAATIAVEMPFLPADLFSRLRHLLPMAKFVDGVATLEEVRAIKSPRELAVIKGASVAVIDAMLAALKRSVPGTTTHELAEALREEETFRGLTFDYCLVAAGRSFNRFPSPSRWEAGMILSLDSGGNRAGYICDMCRMAVMGPPTSAMVEALDEVNAVQMAARGPIRAGAIGHEIYEAANVELSRCSRRDQIAFEAHGMGLISHEAPRLTGSAAVPYPGSYADTPLESGMVLSIETTMKNRELGLVKLEDTLVVTEAGFEAYADGARGWNVVG